MGEGGKEGGREGGLRFITHSICMPSARDLQEGHAAKAILSKHGPLYTHTYLFFALVAPAAAIFYLHWIRQIELIELFCESKGLLERINLHPLAAMMQPSG